MLATITNDSEYWDHRKARMSQTQTIKEVYDQYGHTIGYTPNTPAYPSGMFNDFIDEDGNVKTGLISLCVSRATIEAECGHKITLLRRQGGQECKE